MTKQYLKPNASGPINGILVTSKKVTELELEKSWTPCAYCAFSPMPFNCWAGNKLRPACCIHDVENISNESVYFVKK